MDTPDYKYSDITQKIIGCVMKVHSHFFGMGFPEIVYKRTLIIELKAAGLSLESEVEREIYYQQKLIAKRRLGLIVENKILVELKVINKINNRDVNQLLNYLKVFTIKVGLLLNLGTGSLQFKRFVYSDKSSKSLKNHLNLQLCLKA